MTERNDYDDDAADDRATPLPTPPPNDPNTIPPDGDDRAHGQRRDGEAE